eukprot:TRINITY_DN10871_c0_g1_i1.p1 TRINITY_DN10871_c0_g1~~TRINITY_DN10871_c0_g1_i1.p1  ORF type:complete len:415 (-),score=98.82 TRINITY_DN10871_c0_g1_i1:187-1431(-)
MGSGEESTPVKPSKSTASAQETPSTPSYSDWPTSMQAYYGGGTTPPPFFTPPVASSPTPPPYMWGGQHLMPPYGTPLPYPAIYPHGGFYAHPSVTAAQGNVMTTTETEGKPSDGKDRGSKKKSKGSSGNAGLVSGKSADGGKAASGSANDGTSSGESGSDGSSDASDENTNQQEYNATRKRSFDQMLADGASAQNNNYGGGAVESAFGVRGQPAMKLPVSLPGNSVVPVPATNLNIGMDLWNASSTGPMKPRANTTGVSPAVVPGTVVGREGGMPEHMWIQDEREIKRQRRKQSNRESARRSRMRKQAECEELAAKVETLSNENRTLRNELQRLAEDCEKLTSENKSIMEQLTQMYGHNAISSIDGNNGSASILPSVGGEENSQAHDTLRGSNPVSGKKDGKFFTSNGKLESGS